MNVWDVAPSIGAEGDGAPVPASAAADATAAAAPEPEPAEEISPLGVEPPDASGDPVVDRALGRLTQVDVLPTDRHGEVYEDVHRELREVLAGLDR